MLIDSHCHVPHKNYKKFEQDIIAEAVADEVIGFINIGTNFSENLKASEVALKYANMFCTAAVYPHEELALSLADIKEKLTAQIQTLKKLVAVGECGIDLPNGNYGRAVPEQIKLFDLQLDLAAKHDLPVIIHNRGGDAQVFDLLKKYPQVRGVAHCFSSTLAAAQKFIAHGFYISFAANITYPANKELQNVVKALPLDKILVETDAPYLPPQGHRGEPNYPQYVRIVAEKVAQLKEKTFEEVAEATYRNTCAIFKLKL